MDQIRGSNTNGETFAQVDASFQALRTSIRPMEYKTTDGSVVGGHYGMSAIFSNTAAAPAANSQVFSVRNRDPRMIVALLRLYAQVSVTTAFTTAQAVDLMAFKATAIPINPTGGTPVVPTPASQRMRTALMSASLLLSNATDIVISSGGALTPGASQVLDTQPFGYGAIGATAVGVSGQFDLFNVRDFGGHPEFFGSNEGFVVENGIAMGAAGVCKIGLTMIWAELPAF